MKNNKELNEIIVPEKIKNEISEKWFYLYRWITSDEIKMSIERDFLKILKYVWPGLAIVSIVLYFITNSFYFFLWTILFWIILIVSFLLGISVYRSFLLVKNSFVIVSDTSIYVWWKVLDINKLDELNSDTKYISKVFEEKLFWTSWLNISKQGFYKEVLDNLFSWFNKIWNKSSSRNLNSSKWALLLILLYLVYVIILSISYFLGVLLLWSFTLLLSFINKIILRIAWNKAIIIDDLFFSINKSSLNLLKRKKDIYILLEEAINNDWKEWLLTKINKSLEFINYELDASIENSLKLKDEIENSKYKSMLNFSIYNPWLKKQIKEPLLQIKELLLVSIEWLSKSIKDIDNRLRKVKRKSLIWTLKLQKERLELQVDNTEKNILSLDLYLKKL